jgi:hypothetical protein
MLPCVVQTTYHAIVHFPEISQRLRAPGAWLDSPYSKTSLSECGCSCGISEDLAPGRDVQSIKEEVEAVLTWLVVPCTGRGDGGTELDSLEHSDGVRNIALEVGAWMTGCSMSSRRSQGRTRLLDRAAN